MNYRTQGGWARLRLGFQDIQHIDAISNARLYFMAFLRHQTNYFLPSWRSLILLQIFISICQLSIRLQAGLPHDQRGRWGEGDWGMLRHRATSQTHSHVYETKCKADQILALGYTNISVCYHLKLCGQWHIFPLNCSKIDIRNNLLEWSKTLLFTAGK